MVYPLPETERLNIYLATIQQSKLWLQKEFAKLTGSDDLPIITVGSLSQMRMGLDELIQYNQSRENEQLSKLQYPFMLQVIGDIELDSSRGGLNKHMMSEVVLSKDIDMGRSRLATLRPVRIAMPFSLRTDSVQTILDFAHVMLMNAPRVLFGMEINDNFRIETSMVIDPMVSIPEGSGDSPGTAYQYEGIIVLNTYFGYSYERGLIKSIKFQVVEGPDPDGNMRTYFASDKPDVLFSKNLSYLDYYNSVTGPYGDK